MRLRTACLVAEASIEFCASNCLIDVACGQGHDAPALKDSGPFDAIAFLFEDGLSWAMGGETGRTRTEPT